MSAEAAFWDRIADKYAAKPVDNPGAYEDTLARVRQRLTPNDSVLEVGCGTGSTALTLAPHVAHITGTDYSEGMIGHARRKAAEAGLTNVTFEVAKAGASGTTHEVVMAFNLLHLVPDPAACIAELRERVRPGGLFISKTPCLGNMTVLLRLALPVLKFLGKAPGVQFLTKDGVTEMIRAAGFQILESDDIPAGGRSRYVVARK